MADNNKCAHDACVCLVGENQEYCSDHCENANKQDIVEIRCDCPHPGCA